MIYSNPAGRFNMHHSCMQIVVFGSTVLLLTRRLSDGKLTCQIHIWRAITSVTTPRHSKSPAPVSLHFSRSFELFVFLFVFRKTKVLLFVFRISKDPGLQDSSEHSVMFGRTGNHSMVNGIYHLRVDLRDGVAAGVLLRLAFLSGRFDQQNN